MPEPTRPLFVVGLDLGQVADPSALVVDDQTLNPDRTKKHALRHLQRWHLGTAYPDIVTETADLMAALRGDPVRARIGSGVADQGPEIVLCLDITGVGRAVFDIFRRTKMPGVKMVPITLTGGASYRPHQGGWAVAKHDLASVTSAALQTGQVRIPPGMPELEELLQELGVFKVKVNLATGNESFEAWREKDKDDLVLAAAMAIWYGERGRRRLSVFA
jgi:hypothetical protein